MLKGSASCGIQFATLIVNSRVLTASGAFCFAPWRLFESLRGEALAVLIFMHQHREPHRARLVGGVVVIPDEVRQRSAHREATIAVRAAQLDLLSETRKRADSVVERGQRRAQVRALLGRTIDAQPLH